MHQNIISKDTTYCRAFSTNFAQARSYCINLCCCSSTRV